MAYTRRRLVMRARYLLVCAVLRIRPLRLLVARPLAVRRSGIRRRLLLKLARLIVLYLVVYLLSNVFDISRVLSLWEPRVGGGEFKCTSVIPLGTRCQLCSRGNRTAGRLTGVKYR